MTFKNKHLMIILIGWFAILLSGCHPIIGSGQPLVGQPPIILNKSQSVGQTFTARQAGLQGIELYLTPVSGDGAGAIHLTLMNNPLERKELTDAFLQLETIQYAGWQRIYLDMSDDPDLPAGDYYFEAEIIGSGEVEIANAAGSNYLNGSAYQNGQPSADAQLSFTLIYRPQALVMGLLGEIVQWAYWVLLAVLLFILPGWALFDLLWPTWRNIHWFERLGLSVGVSLALYPVLLLITWLLHIKLGALIAWLPIGLSSIYLFYTAIRSLIKSRWKISIEFRLPDALGLFLLAVLLGLRFYIIRLTAFPYWIDSYHHTTIAQLLVDNGGIFNSWLPYAELKTFTYHFGFHSLIAVFHWVSGLDLPQSVLIGGQILNGLAVLSLYPLACAVGKNRWSGVIALLVAGLLLTIPLYYINWATYTLQTGHTLFTVLIWMIFILSQAKDHPISRLLLASLVLLGLALSHYRVLMYAVVLFGVIALIRWRSKNRWSMILNLVIVVVPAFVLFLPWLMRVASGRILANTSAYIAGSAFSESFMIIYNSFGDLTLYMQPVFWVLFILAAGITLWKQNDWAAVMLSTCLIILLFANPNWIGLPGAGVLKNLSVLLAVYIPAVVLIAGVAGWLVESIKLERSLWKKIAVAQLILGLAFYGGLQGVKIVQTQTATYATRPDLRAANWIKQNTPPDARFLVNAYIAYGGAATAGADGGLWLPVVAKRSTTQPPVTYGTEINNNPEGMEYTNRLIKLIYAEGIDSPDVLRELRTRDVSYIYIGQRQVTPEVYGTLPPLNPYMISASSNYELIYHQDRVWVFKILP